jgi:hypothetical protein
MRVEEVSATAREKVGPPDQRAMEDVLVGASLVWAGTEDRPEHLRRGVVVAVAVRVADVVVNVPVRDGFLV